MVMHKICYWQKILLQIKNLQFSSNQAKIQGILRTPRSGINILALLLILRHFCIGHGPYFRPMA